MEIILGKTAGFCYGVKRAVEEAEKELEKSNEKVFCLGEIIHNKSIINDLTKKGMEFIENVEDAKGKTIIRAHGETKETYEILKEKNIKIKDLTCPKVLQIHEIAKKYSDNNYFIVLIGIKNHPENIGTLSFCGENYALLQEKEDIEKIIKKINETNINNVLIIAQTTYNLNKFNEITEILKEKIENKNIEIKDTICPATRLRQNETSEMSKKVDAMIIIGGKNSSNTTKLYDIASKNCKKVLFVQNSEELNTKELIGCNSVGVMAGASTPKKDIEEIIIKLKKDCDKE